MYNQNQVTVPSEKHGSVRKAHLPKSEQFVQ